MGEIKEEATNEVEAKDSLGSEEEIAAEAAPKEAEEGHVVLTYPERVPNAEKGAGEGAEKEIEKKPGQESGAANEAMRNTNP